MLAPMEAARTRAVLARTPQLDCARLMALMSAAGAEPARALEPGVLRQVELPAAARRYLLAPEETAIAADLAWLSAQRAHILLCSDHAYPPLLRQLTDAPAALYVVGNIEVLAHAQLAMVGSRHPTAAGAATAGEFAACFARAGLTVTGGLSRGIEAAAHAGALRGGGLTLAVCGTGLDRVYPEEHAALAAAITRHGALVSEIPLRTPPERAHFMRRNRLIAGLSLGTLVVEAARVSGALVTARLATEAGREVFAIPGSINSPLARGCNQLIKQGAKLVEEAADVFTELHFSFPQEQLISPPVVPGKPLALDKEYEMLLDALGFEPATVVTLVARTRLPAESVASMLLILELEGRVAALPAGRYGRLP
jgi:DNA processing protein